MPAHFRPVSQCVIACSQDNETPLMRAVSNGYTNTVIELLKAKADVNHKDEVVSAECVR